MSLDREIVVYCELRQGNSLACPNSCFALLCVCGMSLHLKPPTRSFARWRKKTCICDTAAEAGNRCRLTQAQQADACREAEILRAGDQGNNDRQLTQRNRREQSEAGRKGQFSEVNSLTMYRSYREDGFMAGH